jgi:DNA polymerase III subunit epsilon
LSGPAVGFDPHSELVLRALEAIRERPIGTDALARRVFGLRQAPAGLAARLVYELLGSDRRVEVDGGGVWRPSEAPAACPDPLLAELEFAVVDVETTGGSPAGGDRVVEFACVRVRGGAVVGEYESLVDPGLAIPRWITRLTGIDDGMVAGAPRFEAIAGRVRDELDGRVFVAHNAAFDWRFVSEELRLARSELPRGDRLCTVRLARRAVPGLRRRGLDSLARFYDVPIDGRHRAAGDARATTAILVRMLDEAGRRGVETWGQLDAWLAGRRSPSARRRAGDGWPEGEASCR